MKNIITLVLVVAAYSSSAQFSLQPQIGLDNSKTSIKANGECFSPLGMEFAPRVAMRLNYFSKAGHGGFLGVGTSSQSVKLDFADPQTISSNSSAYGKSIQPAFEGGYQFRSKPISLKSCGSNNSSEVKESTEVKSYKSGCGQKTYVSRCTKTEVQKVVSSKRNYVRIIPSAGLSYKPSGSEIITDIKSGQTTYTYKTGWNTAFIAGTAFEFGVNNKPGFVLSVNYMKSLDNSEETINTMANGKTLATTLKSRSSAFNVSMGIPLNLSKSKNSSSKKHCVKPAQSRCGQYKYGN